VSSRHLGTNRYSLIIEITATPTKQTPGTRANRYNLASVRSVSLWQIRNKQEAKKNLIATTHIQKPPQSHEPKRHHFF
jgi:hypothetical protein